MQPKFLAYMIISYNWLSDYLPVEVEPEKLSRILTAIGLEVESLHPYSSVKGSLKGLITGEVLTCEKHPNADKLKITTVNIGSGEPLQIVCGAANVAVGQKVVVATVNTEIHPINGEAFTIKKAKIRSVESEGMLCAEDEIGLSNSHEGIMVLPEDTKIGQPVSELFDVYIDQIFEIGLTPNRMDAMSHLGVAKDVCAWLHHHEKLNAQVKLPFKNSFKTDATVAAVKVEIKNPEACPRYAGVSLTNIKVAESPNWLKYKLKAIGLNPINNIVDISNFILHETGQPIHIFDQEKIAANTIIVKTAEENSLFTTLDDKERKLSGSDLVIADAEGPMCIAGVYGGLNSGVTETTKNIFIEAAWFNPIFIRKTSMLHGLRTDAATHFEKGVDISETVQVLKRTALLVQEIAGGEITGAIIDIYPEPAQKKSIGLKHHYLKKLSGKNYHGDTVKNILVSLGFEIVKDSQDELWVLAPFSKPDISLPADVVEEVMRIDGLDNIEIPASITIAPGIRKEGHLPQYNEKALNYLTGAGFFEIFTNSITNSKYYTEEELGRAVKMINNLSADLDIMRPNMLETGLEVIAHNLNRKNHNLFLFEQGKTYTTPEPGKYVEEKHLSLYACGVYQKAGWQYKAQKVDYYYIKAICENIFKSLGLTKISFQLLEDATANSFAEIKHKNRVIGKAGLVPTEKLQQFGIKEPVIFADLLWDDILNLIDNKPPKYKEITKYQIVERDLAVVLAKATPYAAIEEVIDQAKLPFLKNVQLFDIFESDKLGLDKKSVAINFSFLNENKTLTDGEVDEQMDQLISSFQQKLAAEIRK